MKEATGDLIRKHLTHVDMPALEGLLASFDDLIIVPLDSVGTLRQWRVGLVLEDLPLGYLTARPVSGGLELKFYAMDWDKSRGFSSKQIDGLEEVDAEQVRFDGWASIMVDALMEGVEDLENQAMSTKILAEHKPWEKIPDQGNDRLIVEMLWSGHTDQEIGRRVGLASKTIQNTLSRLRRTYGGDIVPKRNRLRKLGLR